MAHEILHGNYLAIGDFEKTEIHKFACHINMAVEETLNLLNNLLQWAKLQSKNNFHEPETVDLKLVSEDIRRFGGGFYCHPV